MQRLILWNIIIIILSLNSVSFLPMIDSQTLQPQFNSNEPTEKQNKIYKKIKLLGSGSYAKAYLVQQISTSNLYVVKQINIFDMTNSQQQKVTQQAKILQLLNHPNIIKFKEIQTTSKMKLNIVMEYADGGDLAQKIKQAKQQNTYFGQKLILNWFTQICLGIKHIHDRKIIHRDLKGQNIFLTSDNCVKIGDLGVATILQQTVAKAKTIVGTPYYMSPQIMQNKPYSFKTDIWSLGILLYQICTLSPPFTANNLQFLALKIVRGNYQAIPAQYSSQLKTLIRSMLNTNPNLRPNINQILSSTLINKRIKSLLNEQKNTKQFSQTNLLKFKTNKNQIEEKLRPPPNLIQIQQQNQNSSAIIQANKLYQNQIFAELKAKTPNCIGKNPPPIKKKPILNDRKIRPSTAENINDIIKIRATPLQQHIMAPKLPKFISPNIIKKQPQKSKQNPQSIKQHPLSHHIQSQKIGNNKNDNMEKDKIENKNKNAAVNKRKSVDCTQYKISQQQKVMMITKNLKNKNQKQTLKPKEEQIYEQNQLKTKSQNFDNQLDEHYLSAQLAENISGYQNCNQGINKINLQLKSQLSSQNVNKSQKKISKKTSAKQKRPKINKPKQKKQQKQFKLELVSQELQKKQKSQKQKQKNIIKKQPLKKNKPTSKDFIHIQNNEHQIQQIVQQQKCNDASQHKYDYQQQQFEVYQQTQNEQIQQGSDFSFTLSDSSLHDLQPKNRILQEQGKNNYLKMLAELQIITKMVDQAKGNIQNLPIIGAPLSQLLSLSSSQIKLKQSLTISNEDQNFKSNTMLNLELSSNPTPNNPISSLKNTKSLINFACFNDQSQLQNLRIALQQIFGIHNIIKVYKFMEQILEKYGLEFHQEDIIRKILKQCEGVQETCLRRHFKFIVTVIVIQKQIALGNFGK